MMSCVADDLSSGFQVCGIPVRQSGCAWGERTGANIEAEGEEKEITGPFASLRRAAGTS